MNIWQFQERLAAILLGWATASIGAGFRLNRYREPLQQGMGEQFIGWGLINGMIAAFGATSAKRRRQLPDATNRATQSAERRKLARLLWLNTGLDVLYILGGALTIIGRGTRDERWRGRGLGIVIQGGFLFFFDLINALLLGRLPEKVGSRVGDGASDGLGDNAQSL